MLGDHYLIVTGSISVMWTMALIGWCIRNPGERIPSILLACPVVTGVLAIVEGVGRLS